MPRSHTDEAIVLRTYDVGETDRFCVLLTRERGKMVARIAGARKLTSRRGRGLLPLHRVSVTWDEHSYGNAITASQCIDAHPLAWKDAHAFSCAAEGIELLMKFTEDGVSLTEVYDLTAEFLAGCGTENAKTVGQLYALKLLKILGYMPHTDRSSSSPLPASMIRLVNALDTLSLTSPPEISAPTSKDITRFLQLIVGSEFGTVLKAPAVSLCISSGVTPICQVI